MIRNIRGHKLISGFRGHLPVDEQALADCILAVAKMAESNAEIIEIDLNPVIAYPDGILVVDARMIVN
jgi:acyl-CoA synthetase (NDP forming)